MELIGYAASLLMGLSLGMIGGGGSILTVPILVYFFSMPPVFATSASLFVVGSTALFGGLLALKRGDVNLKVGIDFAIPSFAGVYLTKTALVPSIPEIVFSINHFTLTKPVLIMAIFAFLMLTASLAMIRRKSSTKNSTTSSSANKWMVAGQGFFTGSITGLVGAGGGFLIVPALVNLVGLNMRTAIGTSLLIIAANALFGFSVALFNGIVFEWLNLMTILSIALFGLVIGIKISQKVSEEKLKQGFGYFVLIMGLFVLIDQIKTLLI